MSDALKGGYALPVRLEPHPDESLLGLMMRYAGELRFPAPEQMFARLGGRRRSLPTYAALDPSGQGRALAEFLHLSPEHLARMSLWSPAPSTIRLRGSPVNIDLTDPFARRVCPACLLDSCHHRDVWIAAALPACAVHRTRLLRDCPACDRRLTWTGSRVHRCGHPDCGADLRGFDAPAVPSPEMAGIAGLLRILDGEQHASGLAFGEALKAALVLGCLRSGFRIDRRPATLVDRMSAELPTIIARGWGALDPWPGAYHGYLGEFVAAAGPAGGKGGLKGAFGALFGLIRQASRKPWADPLRAELATFAAGRSDVVVRTDVLRRGKWGGQASAQRVSLAEAARAVGVSHWTMQAAAARHGLLDPDAGRGEPVMVPAVEVRRLAEAAALHGRSVTHAEAAATLNVALVTVAALIAAGFLRKVPAEETVRRRRRLRASDVRALLHTFEASARGLPIVAEPGPDHRIIGRGGSKDGYGVVGIVRAVTGGSLRPVAIWDGGAGLRRYLMPRYIRPGARARAPARRRGPEG